MLAEGKGASKTSKLRPSAYRWYGRGRFAQEVKMLSEGNCMLRRKSCDFSHTACSYNAKPPIIKTCVLTVGGFFDALTRHCAMQCRVSLSKT